MAEAFSFPPPPPPPPRREASSSAGAFGHEFYSPYGGTYRGRGGGSSFGGARAGRSRGRGSSARGRGHDIYGNGSRNTNFSHSPISQGQPYGQRTQFPQGASAGNKRPFSTAFDKDWKQAPRTQAAPAVPSFGGDILPSIKPPVSPTIPKKKSRTHNQLGLTPASQDMGASSDEDEEVTLAKTSGITQPDALKFEYRGHNTSLNSPAEITAWIAERKKRYPTAARAELAKAKAEEKRKAWEAGKKAARERKEQISEQRNAQREELRKRALASVAARKEKALYGSQKSKEHSGGSIAPGKGIPGDNPTQSYDSTTLAKAAIPTAPSNHKYAQDSGLFEASSELTSSSGTSDSEDHFSNSPSSDSDLAPEELSTKHHPPPVQNAPLKPPSPSPSQLPQPQPQPQPEQQRCRNFLQKGHCTFGSRCRYSHARSSGQARNDPPGRERGRVKSGRGKGKHELQTPTLRAWDRGLYGIMVADEVAAQRRNAMDVIMAMGEGGMLGEG